MSKKWCYRLVLSTMNKRLYSSMGRFLFQFLLLLFPSNSFSQTEIHISGPQVGFPIAIPQLCDTGGGQNAAVALPEAIVKDLQLSGFFRVINPNSYVETPGKCLTPDKIAFSDWSIIGAEALVHGEIQMVNPDKTMRVQMYLYNVLQQKAVVAKQYDASLADIGRVAHRFANEIVRYFTGEPGIFGTKIVYVSKVGRFKELFITDLDGSNIKQLTRDVGLAVSPSWSSAGDSIVYTSYRTKRPELYTMSPDGSHVRQITNSPGLKISAKFTPDGSSILASASQNGRPNLVFFDLHGKILHRLTSSDAIDVSPSWSPDGSFLTFCSSRSGGPQIYVMTRGGGDIRRISYANSNYCTSPAWSPKGDKIAFTCRTPDGFQIFTVGPDGQQAVQLTFKGDNEDPSWAPDGRYLTFSSALKGGVKNVVIFPLTTANPIKVTSSRSEDSEPAWSPRLE